MNYRWSKACPGVYYLWIGPVGSARTFSAGSIKSLGSGRYALRYGLGGEHIKLDGRATPKTAKAMLERLILEKDPTATFHG